MCHSDKFDYIQRSRRPCQGAMSHGMYCTARPRQRAGVAVLVVLRSKTPFTAAAATCVDVKM